MCGTIAIPWRGLRNANSTVHGGMSPWLLGIAATICAGIVLAVLVWVGATLVSLLQANTALKTQVESLDATLGELKLQLIGVQQFGERIGRLETRTKDIDRRLTRHEDHSARSP